MRKNINTKYWKVTKNYIINKYNIIKDYLLCYENRKKNLTTILALIVFNLFLLTYSSNAFYYDESGLSILRATIGDNYSENYDYVLKIFLENEENVGTYYLSDSIPTNGYTYNKYFCKNGSNLIYDDDNKTTSILMEDKDICEIYLDVSNE